MIYKYCRYIFVSCLVLLMVAGKVFSQTHTEKGTFTKENKVEWFKDARFGMFVHWGLYSILGGSYNGRTMPDDGIKDCYICPEGNELHTNGNWYQKSKERSCYFVKHYKTNKCLGCPALSLCTKNKKGRLLERSEYQL